MVGSAGMGPPNLPPSTGAVVSAEACGPRVGGKNQPRRKTKLAPATIASNAAATIPIRPQLRTEGDVAVRAAGAGVGMEREGSGKGAAGRT